MPAAAVIPAPIAYIKVVAVKKLVVGFLVGAPVRRRVCTGRSRPSFVEACLALSCRCGTQSFTVKKLECFKAGLALNTLAWNNKIGLWSILLVCRPR